MKTHSVYLALSVLILLATVCCKASNAPNIEQEQRIKEFVDRFKNAYYRKDIKTLNAIWGDNMREKALSKEKPKMQMQTKSAYLSKMKYIF
ncbi:MAG: hypothetical protein LBK45_03270, partial [Tannerellaceae bacterium]|nr:hypothetical protein [Tannerellaceae bacterium]